MMWTWPMVVGAVSNLRANDMAPALPATLADVFVPTRGVWASRRPGSGAGMGVALGGHLVGGIPEVSLLVPLVQRTRRVRFLLSLAWWLFFWVVARHGARGGL